ncbi:hypothetical protein E4U56_002231 [Claviceps arundinis]|uniref:Endosomal Vps protein complex subunit n=1 Tax=Claviceps arundinis TaxID=1623583 RepID=A0A9P7MYZ5_9HYPO|nr:hypothetical protein E4U56_002231 [Claviceps arundinis]
MLQRGWRLLAAVVQPDPAPPCVTRIHPSHTQPPATSPPSSIAPGVQPGRRRRNSLTFDITSRTPIPQSRNLKSLPPRPAAAPVCRCLIVCLCILNQAYRQDCIQPQITMETFRAIFAKPDPQAQMRKCNAVIRQNIRKLDRDITANKQSEYKIKQYIIQADKRAQKDPSRSKQAQRDVRDFARELVRHRRASSRLITSKAQLNSVQMQVNEAFAVRKIEGSIRASAGIMKDLNSLIRLPEYAITMRELSTELMKAGIIEEMVEEALPEDGDMLLEDEDAEAEGEVEKVLGEILKTKPKREAAVLPVAPEPEPEKAFEEVEPVEDSDTMMDRMRNRLDALRS